LTTARVTLFRAAIVVAVMATASTALAQDPPNVVQAREHLARGNLLLEQQNFDAALTEFQTAYDIVGEHPVRHVILFNIGKAHERMFRYDLALEYYERYLVEGGPEATDRATVQATIATLQGLLATLDIQTNVASAEVWVNDRMVGTAPGSVRIPGGRHVVELRAAGYAPERQEVQVPAQNVLAMTFTLTALADEYRGLPPVIFWSTAGVAAASLIVGSVVGILALGQRGSVDSQLEDMVGRLEGDRLEEKRSQIQTLSLVADLFFGGAALFGVGALVLAFLTDWGGEGEAEAAPATTAGLRILPQLGWSSAGLSLEGNL
jgi:hypothetical protein